MANEKYVKEFSDEGFWSKIKLYAKKIGKPVLEKALSMYYAAKDSDTPKWAKTIMYGALGYFILPVDAIPDITPVVGYTDDLGVLAAAFGTVAFYIKEGHIQMAKEKIKQWFG